MRYVRPLMVFFCLAVTASSQTFTITDLGVLSGDSGSQGLAVNSAGQVAGCSDTSQVLSDLCVGFLPGHAFLWTSSLGMQDLGTLPGGSISYANDVNDVGQVVGASDPGLGNAFLWTSTAGMVPLPSLPGGDQSSANGINSHGETTGFSSAAPSGAIHVVVWTADGKIHDLGTGPNGADAYGLHISNKGQVVGNVLNPLNQGFVWTKASGARFLPKLPGGTQNPAIGLNSEGLCRVF